VLPLYSVNDERNCVNNIDTLAPLDKSDHAILLIETTLTSMESAPDQKYNYNKGDCVKLRSHVDCDWDKEFISTDLDVEAVWNMLKTKLMMVLCVTFL